MLVDSTAAVERHWRRFAGRHGLDPALLGDVHGRRSADVIRSLAAHLRRPVEEAVREFAAHDADDQAGVSALPGAAQTVTRLPRHAWGVVTSGSAAVACARLAAAGLPVPEVLVTADDVKSGKPDPAPYRLGAQRLGLPPAACLAIEDAPQGLLSATRAGCRTLALLTTHPRERLSDATATATNLAAVTLLLSSAGSPT